MGSCMSSHSCVLPSISWPTCSPSAQACCSHWGRGQARTVVTSVRGCPGPAAMPGVGGHHDPAVRCRALTRQAWTHSCPLLSAVVSMCRCISHLSPACTCIWPEGAHHTHSQACAGIMALFTWGSHGVPVLGKPAGCQNDRCQQGNAARCCADSDDCHWTAGDLDTADRAQADVGHGRHVLKPHAR